jgi:hypothetical protein
MASSERRVPVDLDARRFPAKAPYFLMTEESAGGVESFSEGYLPRMRGLYAARFAEGASLLEVADRAATKYPMLQGVGPR